MGAEIWKQDFAYDRYGNRTIDQTNTWGPAAGPAINKKNFTVDTSNNRLGVPAGQSGTMSYDSAGNLTTDTYSGSGVMRAYDAENRMTSETQSNGYVAGSYGYNADGQRVRRTVGGQPSAVTTWQVYGMAGELLAEYAANAPSTTPQKEYGYRNGQLLVTAESPAGTNVALAANGGVASASSAISGFPASGTNNGDRKGANWGSGGGWADSSSGSFPDWLQIDFNGSKTISEVDVFTLQDSYSSPSEPAETMTFSTYGLTAYDVQYWNGSTWVTITGGNITGNNKVWRKINFSSVTTTKIKVLTNAAVDNGYSRITEVEAWGSDATTTSTSNINWLVTDQLGTPRMIFDKTGSLAATKRHDYLPFGEEIFSGTGGRTTAQGYGAADGVRQKFTQKERDNETGLDYFLARYYSSTQGRFTNPDEFKGGPDELYVLGSGDQQKQALPYADITQPGSLNKYSYVFNNPLRFVDPDGHCGTPSGLKPGQVGICVASFIKSKLFPPYTGPGRGDGRNQDGQGGTSRVEVRVVVDPGKGTVTKTDEAMGRSGLIIKGVGLKGSGGSRVSEPNKDKGGNIYFQINQHGDSAMNVNNAFGTIDNHLNMVVTPDSTPPLRVGLCFETTASVMVAGTISPPAGVWLISLLEAPLFVASLITSIAASLSAICLSAAAVFAFGDSRAIATCGSNTHCKQSAYISDTASSCDAIALRLLATEANPVRRR